MTRVLHLHDRHADFQTERGAQQLTAKAAPPSRALTIGPGGDFPNTPAAALRLRRPARDVDLCHAWGLRALAAAALAPFPRIVFSPTTFPTPRHARWLRAIIDYRDVTVACPTSTIRRALVERGVPVDRCPLVRPGVDFARVRPRRDPALRAALGFDDAHTVLLAVGESTRAADHRTAAWAGTIHNVLDQRTRMLLWGRGPLAPAVARFGARLAQPELVTLAEQRLGRPLDFEEILPAADVLVVSATAPVPTLSIAIAMASGVAIAATVTPTVAELLEDRHTALMCPPASPRLLAQKIAQLREDADLRYRLADRARTEVYDYFSQTRFVEGMREVYRGKVAAAQAHGAAFGSRAYQ
jgi:glycosyltransferase involved in cell wall biosynthesis